MDFYVYRHIRRDTGEVFYIGKGFKNRAYSFLNRNPYWHNIVNKCGFDVEISKTLKSSYKKNPRKYRITTCPHCGKSGGQPNMTRYHFDNCKRK